MAVGSVDLQVVNDAVYRRIVPLIGADADTGKVPPAPVLWLASRVHPELRRRERIARWVMAGQSMLEPVQAWFATERDQWRVANLLDGPVGVVGHPGPSPVTGG